jgi:cysteine desulfurase
MSNRIFLDANAGLPTREEVLEAYLRTEREVPANPASTHRSGRRAQAVLEDARSRVAARLRCEASQVVFTSGATEADNLGLVGTARALRRMHGAAPALFASAAEHPAALAPLRLLQREGCPLTLVDIDRHARVDADALVAGMRGAPAAVVALQWANNETGAVQPLAAVLAEAAPDRVVHVDAVQGVGKLPWDAALERASGLAVSGHKIGAPKGVGVLRVRDDVALDAVLAGGGQQKGRRGGTESPALAVAFATALDLAMDEQQGAARHTASCVAAFLGGLRSSGVSFEENHPPAATERLPNTCNLAFPGVDGRALMPACDLSGLDVASGAACSSGAALPSAVLRACGLTEELAQASLRASFSPSTTVEEAREAADRLATLLRRLYEVAKR